MARRTKENAVDWDAVERQYRLGTRSNKQLGLAFDVSFSAIGRRAAKYGWVADKSKDVEATANSLLIQNASGNANPNATPTALEVKVAAQVSADVVLSHRVDIGRTRALFRTLLEEVEVTTDPSGQTLIRALAELVNGPVEDESPEESARRVDRMRRQLAKLLDGSARIDNAKRLTEMLEKLVRMEREAFGIDSSKNGDGGIDDLLMHLGRLAA